MKKLISILFFVLPFILKAQTQPPIVQGSKLYEFKNGLRVDSALFLPRKDTGTADVTMLAAGMLVYRPLDSLLYYRKGNAMTALSSTGDLSNYYTKTQSDARYVHYTDTASMLLPYLRKIDTTAMLNPYVRDAYRHIDSITVKRPTDSTIIDLQLPVVNPTWFGAIANDGISDRQAIQAAINYAAGRGILISGPGQWDIDSTLMLPSGTTWRLQDAALIKLMDGSDCAMVSNENKTTAGNLTIQDSLITIIGGYWEGNGNNQIKFMPDGTPVVGFLFAGVRNLYLSPKKIHNTQTYAIGMSNVTHSMIEGITIDQGPLPGILHNQDGVHIQGIARFITVKDLTVKTYDDAVAFNADDVAQGPYLLTTGDMHDISIENIKFDTTRKGIRLLSATSRMDRVLIRNLKGTTIDNVLEASAYILGAGNFGSISIEDIDVASTGTPMVLNEYISFNHKFDRVFISNIKRTAINNTRNTILFKEDYEAAETVIKNTTVFANTTNTFADVLAKTGSSSKTFILDGHQYIGGSPLINNAIELDGFTSSLVKLSNLAYDSVHRAIYLSSPSIKSLQLNNNVGLNVDTSMHINNAGNVDTLYLNGNILRDKQSRAFIVNTATVSRVKAYMPLISTLGGTATIDPIKYTSSNVGFTLTPVTTLQDVTSNSVATSNFIKGTGQANLKNGAGWELFYDAGNTTGTFQTFDRGGTNALQKTLIQGTPVMLNSRILVGVNVSTTDDGSTVFQVKGSESHIQTTVAVNTTLGNHNIVRTVTSGITFTLPTASGVTGRAYEIINDSAGSVNVSAVLVFGVSTTLIPTLTSWRIYSDGAAWRLMSRSN